MQASAQTNIISLFKTELSKNGFVGEFHIDYPTRLVNATDNSIYEVLPLAVAEPSGLSDLKLLLRLANNEPFKSLYFCARGGGTGTNGQSLTDGVVLDVSRFMTKTLDFSPAERSITVEPGVVLSDLNRYLLPYGLFYAPHVSTADRATIGGMIATDAAGKGSLIYGKTADHLLGLHVIFANGRDINTIVGKVQASFTTVTVKPPFVVSDDQVPTTSLTELARQITTLLAPVQAEIAARFPVLKRSLSGYNIRQCYQNGTFNFNYLIAGSEGTLGIIAAAKLKLLPIPKYKALLIVHYTNFLAALQDAQFLIQFQPLAIEVIDEKVQQCAKMLPEWPIMAQWLPAAAGKSYIANFVEFVADSQQELVEQLESITMALSAKGANFVTITDFKQIRQLWSIRSLAVGLVGKMPGSAKPVPFVEDVIVPPQHLASFVADLQQELDKRQLKYAMYGHVDVGCIHVRPALDLQQAEERQKIRPITEMVIALVSKYQGILWGEHGKGYRGEFIPAVFGPILYDVLCQIKKICDPHNKLNPGKLTSPQATALTRIERVPMRGQFDQIIADFEQQKFAGAMLCNGNAACFNQEPSNVMCPSYKVTKDRIHSPKGRAMLIKEWLREKAKGNGNDYQVAEMAFNALSGCLGCKGCAGKCPTQVNIPDLRSIFLAQYHKHYKRRSLRDLALGRIETILLLAATMPRLWNFVQRYKLMPSLGLTKVPVFKMPQRLKYYLKQLKVTIYVHSRQIKDLPPQTVVIFADVFNALLDPAVLIAAIQTLQIIGFHVAVIYPRVSGKALIVGGYIHKFKLNSDKLAALLNPLFAAQIPVVVLENTITLMLRDEFNKFARPLNGQVLTLAELLKQPVANGTVLKDLSTFRRVHTAKYCLMPHCTEQAILPSEAAAWQAIFTSLGAELEVKNLGCCGMAGAYGYLKEQQQNSTHLFMLHWAVALEQPVPLATGFSCRAQVEKQSAKRILHPIELINQWLESN